jgi:2-dehydro-3-deoxyphosphooctonate aldolase (KDO 8-P synthase)
MKPFSIVEGLDVRDHAPFFFIGGPCVIESFEHMDLMCGRIAEICAGLNVPFIFKASFDKANRSALASFRGPGMLEGVALFKELKKKHHVLVLTDIHDPQQAETVASVVDILQIPAFLCRQTDLLIAAGRTGRVVNIKKGQFMAPWDMKNAVQKVQSTGNTRVLLTEMGFSFGYNNLVVDFRSLQIMKRMDCGVVFDATHSVQLPGGEGSRSGGEREFIAPLAQAAVSVGIHGLFMEVHDQPERALSDGPNACPLQDLEPLLKRLKQFDRIAKER